jgi:uncharacterized membrane protein
MSSARDILDERLARGEISADEHATLAARLGSGTAAAPLPERPSDAAGSNTRTNPAIVWNAIGVAVAAGWALFTNQIVQNLINSCAQNGGSLASCQATSINWPMVYGSYGLALLIGVSCVVSIVAATKRA